RRAVEGLRFPCEAAPTPVVRIHAGSMRTTVGHISGLFRYPIKSMAGVRLDSAALGWHGIAGDRRLAFRRLADRGAFPWLTASRLPELLLYRPFGRQDLSGEPLPTHVRAPNG